MLGKRGEPTRTVRLAGPVVRKLPSFRSFLVDHVCNKVKNHEVLDNFSFLGLESLDLILLPSCFFGSARFCMLYTCVVCE